MNDLPETLQQSLNDYFAAFERRDAESLLQKLHPGLFRYVPEEQLRQLLRDQLSDESNHIQNIRYLNCSNPIMVNEQNYILVLYYFEMLIGSAFSDLAESFFVATYGKENVIYDPKKSIFVIQTHGQLYAIQSPEGEDWVFLEKKDALMNILEVLLPSEVLMLSVH
ncbi:MAG: hypothetical protein ACFCUI_12075 [Bernardetiaceae bacterium]